MELIPGPPKRLQIRALAVDPGWLKEIFKKGKFLEFSCFEELVGSHLWVKGSFFRMFRNLSLECSGFWSFSVHQKIGLGPASLSTILLSTAPDYANMDMRDRF